MSDEIQPGSFEEFKKSFTYGSRNDLNFKFLAGLSDEDAATFFQELLWKLGDTLDDGSADRLIAHATTWQVRAYAGESSTAYDEGPFTPHPMGRTIGVDSLGTTSRQPRGGFETRALQKPRRRQRRAGTRNAAETPHRTVPIGDAPPARLYDRRGFA